MKKIVGERIGNLVCEREVERSSHGEMIYEWRCDCGNSLIRSKQSIVRRKNKNCGCASYKKICPVCKREFQTRSKTKKYCSILCQEGRVRPHELKHKPKKIKPKIETAIGGMAAEAHERGMTYGQLQALRYKEDTKWGR